MASQSTTVVERTKSRRRILKSGVIAYSGRQVTIKCTVRDMSECGARLIVEGAVEAPDTFELLIDLDGIEVECKIAWRRGKDLGVTFTGPVRASERRRIQVLEQWSGRTKPTLRRQAKPKP